ncbi:C4-dicarboxylate ABC transporter permease [Marinobacterium nitratireducens]|uniref:C4-dicarboxylate ABC transporter permease n=1 Tax=Marinobacterium nitratireducens TaxID=518897 RepID=A0A917ZL84_9GAMM|nr:tripartite tricarboxylate transporter permease [Marinobacterium nitratireducens]GGO84181.1 C4-dicarboxylate ABC transporter permease [Marinobacterium nitratireducens]
MELLSYLLEALTPINLLLALAGVVAGTIIGSMPGLSATMAVAVLVPFTYTMAPASGLIMLGAIYTGAIYGGAFAAILVNTPGTPSAIATTFDGFPMAKRGEGALAITLATVASVVGGLVGGISLLLLAPPLAEVALAFGPAEYFWLAIFGLTLISALSVGNTIKGLIGACIGLLLSVVGVAVVGGDIRYTFDSQALLGGIDITSAIIGLYCIPVLIDLVATKDPHITMQSVDQRSHLREAFRFALGRKLNMLRSSVIGTIVGILPGAGGSIAGLVAYTEARRASRHPERFGKGEPDGLIATESANNATVGGGFIPTLVLGIPGTPPDAIILGALLVQGIKIGPTLFTAQGDVVYTFIYGLLIATLLMLPAGLLLGRYAFKSISKTPKTLLVPTVAFLTVIGSFAIHSNAHDTLMMCILGVAAWILNRFGFAPSPIVLGLVLGQIAEQGFVQTYLIGNAQGAIFDTFFGRPISLGIIICAALALFYPLIAEHLKRRKDRKEKGAIDVLTEAKQANTSCRSSAAIGFAALFIATGVGAYVETQDMSAMGAVFPGTIAVIMVVLAVILAFQQLRLPRGQKVSVEGHELDAPRESNIRRILAVVVLGAWAVLLPVLGFCVSSLLAFIALTANATFERPSKKEIVVNLLSAVVIVGGFYLLMTEVLLIRMPESLFF